MNLLKQRARVLGSTSECERVIGCEKAAGGTLGKEPPRGASWGSQCSSEYIEIADAFPACKVRACRRLVKAAGL